MLQFYCEHYPALEGKLPQVSKLIEDFLKRDASEELELRIGSFENGQFKNGVSQEFFEHTIQLVEEFDGFSSHDPNWIQTVDYFYRHKNIGLRSRVNETGPVETVIKTVRDRADIEVYTEDRDFGLAKLLPGAFRIQAAKEANFMIGANDDLGMTLTFLRLKQRRHFLYKEWRFDFSKVWTGANFQEADRAFFTKNPSVYEIEIEFVGGSCKTPVQLAVSLLLKVLDFFPENVMLQ